MAVDQTKKQVFDHNLIRNKWAIASIIMFLLCVASSLLLYFIEPKIALVLVAIFGIATFVCATRIENSSKTEQLQIITNPTPLDHIKLAEGLEDGFKVYGVDGSELTQDTIEAFVASVEVNRQFITKPLKIEIPDELYGFEDPTIIPYTAYLKDNRDKELSKFAALRPDKAVMGIDSPIDLETFEDLDKPLRFVALSRYAVQVTDDAFNKLVINKKKVSDKIVYNGRSCCIDENGHLLDFRAATNANQVDMRSLIISNDGYIMFRKGTKLHPLFADKVIGSASCSLLPEEVDVNRPIQECMIESIHNKIRVLYDIPQNTKMTSSFCGFARIVNRGCAPEFFCITRLDMSKDAIVKAHRDETAMFIEEMLTSMVPELDTVEDAAAYIADAIKTLRSAVGDDISIAASAMMNVIMDAMEDSTMSTKVLQRIELIER